MHIIGETSKPENNEGKFSLDDIPFEILRKIMSYASRNIINMAAINTSLHKTIFSRLCREKNIHLNMLNSDIPIKNHHIN